MLNLAVCFCERTLQHIIHCFFINSIWYLGRHISILLSKFGRFYIGERSSYTLGVHFRVKLEMLNFPKKKKNKIEMLHCPVGSPEKPTV